MSEQQQELLSISDFFVILFKRRYLFLAIWFLIMGLTVTYLAVAKKSYKLSGTIYVGRFQRLLVEEGEFVANKLEDYSFIKRALEAESVEIDITINRLQRLIEADVVNEVKKNEDVGIVRLTVEYKDPQKVLEIFQALTNQLIKEHGELIGHSKKIFKEMEEKFWESENKVRNSLDKHESMVEKSNQDGEDSATVPAHLLAQHTVSEKNEFLKRLVQDIHYLRIEGESATRSFNTKLAAKPKAPDEHFKPKGLITLIIGLIAASLAATISALAWELFQVQIRPKL